MGNSPLVLIVRHGSGRAFPDEFLLHVLEHIGETDPKLRRLLVSHDTGEGEPSLEGVATIVFALRDPLRQRHPDCFAEAEAIAARAESAGIRVVNSPQALSNTAKSIQARTWAEKGLPAATHVVFGSEKDLLAGADGLAYPVMLKSNESHRQEGMCVCRDSADVRNAVGAQELQAPVAAASFIDTRRGYVRTQPGSLWARFYHKKRAVVLGDVVRSRHVLFSRHPIVSLRTCTLSSTRKRGHSAKSRWKRVNELLSVGNWLWDHEVTRRSVDEDNEFFFSSPEEPELLRDACRVLGLEVATVDYSTQANGEIVLWEANAFCTLETPEKFLLPEVRRYAERRRQTLDDVAHYLSGLVNEAKARRGTAYSVSIASRRASAYRRRKPR